jgi:hypothetical protein
VFTIPPSLPHLGRYRQKPVRTECDVHAAGHYLNSLDQPLEDPLLLTRKQLIPDRLHLLEIGDDFTISHGYIGDPVAKWLVFPHSIECLTKTVFSSHLPIINSIPAIRLSVTPLPHALLRR